MTDEITDIPSVIMSEASTSPSIRPADLAEYEIYIPPRCENNYIPMRGGNYLLK